MLQQGSAKKGPLYYLCQQEALRKEKEFQERMIAAREEKIRQDRLNAIAAAERLKELELIELQKNRKPKRRYSSCAPHFEEQELPNISVIRDAVCNYFDISYSSLCDRSRLKRLVYLRHIAFWVSYRYTDRSLSVCGNFFGRRDHTTVLNSLHKIKWMLVNNREQARTDVNNILVSLVDDGMKYSDYWGA